MYAKEKNMVAIYISPDDNSDGSICCTLSQYQQDETICAVLKPGRPIFAGNAV